MRLLRLFAAINLLRDDRLDRFAVIYVEPLAARNFELMRIEAELMQNGSVDISHVMSIFNGVETEFISCAMNDSWLDPAASEPCAKPLRVMIAPGALGAR